MSGTHSEFIHDDKDDKDESIWSNIIDDTPKETKSDKNFKFEYIWAILSILLIFLILSVVILLLLSALFAGTMLFLAPFWIGFAFIAMIIHLKSPRSKNILLGIKRMLLSPLFVPYRVHKEFISIRD